MTRQIVQINFLCACCAMRTHTLSIDETVPVNRFLFQLSSKKFNLATSTENNGKINQKKTTKKLKLRLFQYFLKPNTEHIK